MNDCVKRFVSVKEACAVSGLSQAFIRQGCKDGRFPYILNGNRFIINLPALLEVLDNESRGACS